MRLWFRHPRWLLLGLAWWDRFALGNGWPAGGLPADRRLDAAACCWRAHRPGDGSQDGDPGLRAWLRDRTTARLCLMLDLTCRRRREPSLASGIGQAFSRVHGKLLGGGLPGLGGRQSVRGAFSAFALVAQLEA